MIHFSDSSLSATPAELLTGIIQPDTLFLLAFQVDVGEPLCVRFFYFQISKVEIKEINDYRHFFRQNMASQVLTSDTV